MILGRKHLLDHDLFDLLHVLVIENWVVTLDAFLGPVKSQLFDLLADDLGEPNETFAALGDDHRDHLRQSFVEHLS